MQKFINSQLKFELDNPVFEIISQASDSIGVESYVIGGYVRDFIMGRLSKDIDIVTVGSGIDLAQRVSSLLGKSGKIKIFKKFGTAMLRVIDMEIEFVGARKESYRSDSRNPIVENGTLMDDISRRDFTINTLAISLNKSNYGQLLNEYNGLHDIETKLIRTPLDSDLTYSDDPLRMMRAIRFASQLEFEIEKKSFSAIKKNAGRISIISMERISDELNKIILSPKPSLGFKLLDESGLLNIIFPEFSNLKGIEKVNNIGHKDVFLHTLEVLDNLSQSTDDLWLRWAAILHDIAKPKTKTYNPETGWTFHGHEFAGSKMVPGIFKNLKLPLNDKMKYVQKLVLLHLRPIALIESEVSDSAIRRLLFEAGDDIDDLMLMCNSDITSKNRKKVLQFRENFELVKEKLKEIEEKDKLRNWQPPISGEYIMKAFNIPPSKEVGIIKNSIREAILEGQIPNIFEDASAYMISEGIKLGLTPQKNLDKL